jgi:hypothetical protein
MITPIGFLAKLLIFVQDLDGHAPFYYSEVIRNRYLWRYHSNQCKWSICTLSSTTSQPDRSEKARIQLSTSWPSSSVKIQYRYFGVHKMWYWQCHIVCDNLMKSTHLLLPDLSCWGNSNLGCNKWVVQKAKPTGLWSGPEDQGFQFWLNQV